MEQQTLFDQLKTKVNGRVLDQEDFFALEDDDLFGVNDEMLSFWSSASAYIPPQLSIAVSFITRRTTEADQHVKGSRITFTDFEDPERSLGDGEFKQIFSTERGTVYQAELKSGS